MRALDRTTCTLTWRLLRGGGRNGRLATLLSVVAAAVCTMLLLLCVAANLGFAERAAGSDWRNPVQADASEAVAVQAVGTAFADGQPVTVVDVAALPGGGEAPAPPGMPRFPEPGEVWTSPALGTLHGRDTAGTLGPEALTRPGEKVAVVGHRAGAPEVTTERGTDPRRSGDLVTPTPVADFTGERVADGFAVQYQDLAKICTVLVAMPLVLLGASSARLSVSRRDSRLATLRLLGAEPSRITGMTAVEALLTAAAGAVAGTLGYLAMLPLAAEVPVGGGSWYVADLWVGVPVLAAVLAGVVLTATASAVVGLRQVVVGPLGVVRRSRPPRMSLVRALVFVGVLVGYWQFTRSGRTEVGVIVYLFGAVFLALSVVGPWVVGMLGALVARSARRAPGLLAGRRLLDDPKSAWRGVSGLTLAAFAAGVFALFSFSGAPPWGAPDRLALAVPKGQAAAVEQEFEDRLERAGVEARIATDDDWVATGTGERDEQQVTATVADRAQLDAAREALVGVVPGQYPITGTETAWQRQQFQTDSRLAMFAVLGASFAIAATSAGVTAASTVLDRRRTYGLLHLAGTPLRVLDAARRTETALPALVLTGAALVTGFFCAAPLTFAGGEPEFDTGSIAILTGCFVLGFAGLLGASAASRPLLRSVVAESGPRPD
ncbi:FtsX-like permease family protein [Streptomyces xiaopingdaonensis]|uniref:FtsX-like permease family protein n=1 Tax=Streptomyces xiaopingdaonensis TaxID=1565415 RepID=UPI0002D3CD71|nr:FtsX-like permease family protein [Streptomyces xiaopingdaonensis]